MNNNISFRIKSQNKFSISRPLSSEIKYQPENCFKKMPKGKIALLDNFISFCARYLEVRPSQTTLGSKSSICRQYTNECIQEFCELGIIKKVYRHNNTCIYEIDDFFNKKEIRDRLLPIFKSMAIIPFIWMLSTYPEKTTPVNLDYLVSCASASPVQSKKSDFQVVRVQSKQKKKRDDQMEQKKEIPVYVLEIKELDLTEYGRMRLSCFPEAAIQHARNKIRTLKSLQEPFGYFFKVCRNWCAENNASMDFLYANQLSREAGYDDSSKTLNSNKITGAVSRTAPEKAAEKKVLSSVDRYTMTQTALKAKSAPTREERIATLYGLFQRALYNLTRVNQTICPEDSKRYIEAEINEISIELAQLEEQP